MSEGLIAGLPAVLAGMCSISFIYFGFYILPTALKDKRFRHLMYSCFFSCAWSFIYVMYFLSVDPANRDFWQRFTFAGQLAFVFILLFWLRYTGLIRSRAVTAFLSIALWVPPLIGAYKGISENAVVRDFPAGFWFLYAQIQSTIYNFASVALFLVFHLRQKTNKSRMQVYFLVSSGLVLVTLSWIADYIFGYTSTPNIMPFWLLLWIGIILFTIKKYRLISIMPDFISRDITENIEEGIILLDPNFKVIFRNRSVLALLNAGPNEPLPWMDTVMEKHVLEAEFSRLIKSESDSFRARVNIQHRGPGKNKIPVDMKAKKVIDAFNDVTGYLVIVSMVKDLDHLKALRGITARELDVIRQLATGKTNREIAGTLRMAERTVETHITSIFAKIGIKNRTELMSVLSDYEPFQKSPPQNRGEFV